MKVIIMGCGRVGEQVARRFDQEGHDVTILDRDVKSRARLGPPFRGRVILGIGFDRKALTEAGIEQADAFAAVSNTDNANIVAARIARHIYRVPRVVARLFDPRQAEIYQRLGLPTISSTTWGAERIYETLSHGYLDPIASFGHGEVSLYQVEATPQLVGRQVKDVSLPGEIGVVAISNRGRASIPLLGTVFAEGDVINFAVAAPARQRFQALLGLGEGG
jgi:trk system potassium uptake protein TrkA